MSTSSTLTLAVALSSARRSSKSLTTPPKTFDPLSTLAQILLLQLFFYLNFVTTHHILTIILPAPSSSSLILPRSPIFSHTVFTSSYLPSVALFLSICPTSLIFALVVADGARSLDFAATIFGTHWIVVVARSGWPSWKYWAINVAAAAEFAIGGFLMCKGFESVLDHEHERGASDYEDEELASNVE